jgi:hypothetical protein
MKSVHAAMILGIGSLCLATSLFSAPINGVLFGIALVTFAARGGFKGLTISAPALSSAPVGRRELERVGSGSRTESTNGPRSPYES